MLSGEVCGWASRKVGMVEEQAHRISPGVSNHLLEEKERINVRIVMVEFRWYILSIALM